MKAWSKYNQAVNDPVRNLDMRITFQNGGAAPLLPSLSAANVSHTRHSRFTGRALLNQSILVLSRAQDSDAANGSVPVPLDDDILDAENDTRAVIEPSDEQQSVRLHTPPLTYEIPSLPQNIETAITGAGCAVLQVCELRFVFRCRLLTADCSTDRRGFTGGRPSRRRFPARRRCPFIRALNSRPKPIKTSLRLRWLLIFALGRFNFECQL